MASLAIIGGGVSGLAAGIYAQLSGIDSEIFESHTIVGGQCTAWKRKGFHIDNCVHWMIGTKQETETYQVWKDVGVLGEGKEILRHDYFLKVNIDGITAHVWRDLDKMRAELLAIAPEDEKEIKKLIRAIKHFQAIKLPSLKPKEQMSLTDNLKLVLSMLRAIPVAAKYGKMSIEDYAKCFKNPVLKALIANYLPKHYYVLATFYMYAMFSLGNVDLPLGGSDMITNRMRDRYLALGGKISCRKKAIKLTVDGTHVTQINFEDGTVNEPENIICATDPDVTFKLLGQDYMDDFFRKCYSDKKCYPIFSEINIYFAVDIPTDFLPSMEIFNCEPYEIAGKTYSKICMNNYADQPKFAPEGKGLIQILIDQYEDDYDYWANLYNTNREAYKQAKSNLADEIKIRLEKHYPELQNILSVVEIVTPKSFNRYTGAYKGSYMGFIQTPYVKKEIHPGVLKGLDNFYLAGQWLQTPGGLPNAVITGRFAVQRLLKRNDKINTFCCLKNN